MQGSGGAAGWWTGSGRAGEWWRPDPPREQSRPADGGVGSPPDVAGGRAAFWGLMGFTFVMLIAPQNIVPALKPLRLAWLCAVGSGTALLIERFHRRRPLAILTREMWIAAALLVWAAITVPYSFWPGGSASFLVGFYSKAIAIFWLLVGVLTTTVRIRRVVWALVAMSVPLALVGAWHFASGVFFRPLRSPDKRILGYVAGLTENPNDLALMLNLLLPLAVALLLITKHHRVRLALLAVIALDVTGVMLTFSRAGFLTLATIFFVYLWKFRGRSAARGIWALVVVLLVVALAGLPLLPGSYVNRLSTITDIKADRSGSAKARWEDNFVALGLVARHPIIGGGVGQSTLALNKERGKRWTDVHNVYLEYAVDLGLPGLALFLLLVARCFWSTRLVQRETAGQPASRELFCLAEGVHVSLMAFAVGGMFHPVAYHFYFYYMAGLAVALRETWWALKGAQPGAGDPSPLVSR